MDFLYKKLLLIGISLTTLFLTHTVRSAGPELLDINAKEKKIAKAELHRLTHRIKHQKASHEMFEARMKVLIEKRKAKAHIKNNVDVLALD